MRRIHKFYEEQYTECINNWRLISEKRVEIKGLSCVSKHFYSGGTKGNLTFFFVNDIIIGIAFEYCENVNIFGEEW